MALQETLMLTDARISNPYSTENKFELYNTYAHTLEQILALPETFELHGDTLTGDSYMLCYTSEPVFFDDQTVRLVQYGDPGDAIYFTVQMRSGDSFHSSRVFEFTSPGKPRLFSPVNSLLVYDETLYLLMLFRFDHVDEQTGAVYETSIDASALRYTDKGIWERLYDTDGPYVFTGAAKAIPTIREDGFALTIENENGEKLADALFVIAENKLVFSVTQ